MMKEYFFLQKEVFICNFIDKLIKSNHHERNKEFV